MNYKTLTMTLLLGLGAYTTAVQAEEMMHDMAKHEGHNMAQMEGMEVKEAGEMVMTKGVITRIDAANNKVGIKHEAIDNLKMPAMTMVFVAADPAMLNDLKVGEAVSFHAESVAGKLTLTQLKKQ